MGHDIGVRLRSTLLKPRSGAGGAQRRHGKGGLPHSKEIRRLPPQLPSNSEVVPALEDRQCIRGARGRHDSSHDR